MKKIFELFKIKKLTILDCLAFLLIFIFYLTSYKFFPVSLTDFAMILGISGIIYLGLRFEALLLTFTLGKKIYFRKDHFKIKFYSPDYGFGTMVRKRYKNTSGTITAHYAHNAKKAYRFVEVTYYNPGEYSTVEDLKNSSKKIVESQTEGKIKSRELKHLDFPAIEFEFKNLEGNYMISRYIALKDRIFSISIISKEEIKDFKEFADSFELDKKALSEQCASWKPFKVAGNLTILMPSKRNVLKQERGIDEFGFPSTTFKLFTCLGDEIYGIDWVTWLKPIQNESEMLNKIVDSFKDITIKCKEGEYQGNKCFDLLLKGKKSEYFEYHRILFVNKVLYDVTRISKDKKPADLEKYFNSLEINNEKIVNKISVINNYVERK